MPKKGSNDVGRIPNLIKERSTKGFYNLQNDNLNRGVYQFGLWRSFLLSRKCPDKLRKQKCRKTLQGQDCDCKGLRNHIIRKCIGVLQKVFPQEDFGEQENNSPFPFKNIFLWGSNRTSSLDYNAHTRGGGTSLEKSTSKNTPRKKIFPLLSLKKTPLKALRYTDKFHTNIISHNRVRLHGLLCPRISIDKPIVNFSPQDMGIT